MVASETNHYRWSNERGEPIYSDRPPPKGTDYEVISSSSRLKRSVSAEEGAVPPELTPEAADGSGGSKKNTGLCEKAKMNLLSLQGTHKVSVRDDQGQVRELSPQEREIAKQTAQATIDMYCD
jgi:hypothetical protein